MASRTADDKRMLDLRRSAQLDANLVKRLVSACDAFSNGQIDAMLRAGIRVWPMVGSPSPYDGWQMPTPAARAAYTDHARVVLVRDNARTSDLRHELAHAWDHVKADKLRGRLDAMPREKRDRLAFAPELFEALEREAKKHGHRRLDRQALAAALTP
jgi:hypothetical protein